MKYFKKIIGEKVYLSPINPDDYEIYTKWLNNPNITKYLINHTNMITLYREREFLEIMSTKEYNYAIVKNDDTLIGVVSLDKIDYKNGTATLGIFIGDEENLSKGYGSEAIKLLLDFSFNNLRLHNIMLTVYDTNERAIRAYKKCGFQEFGRRRDALFRDGKYHDVIYMQVLSDKI